MATKEMRDLRETCRDVHRFLEDEFGFYLIEKKSDARGFVLRYASDVAGVKISFEIRDPFRTVVYRLIDGRFPPRTRGVNKDTRLYAFDLSAIEGVRGTDRFQRDDTELYAVPTPEMISERAQALRSNAEPLLRGDFSMAPALEAFIKRKRRVL